MHCFDGRNETYNVGLIQDHILDLSLAASCTLRLYSCLPSHAKFDFHLMARDGGNASQNPMADSLVSIAHII
ncbi:hypothetical protein LshimejAT787_1602180 [Lyophyllum shimeji]|uniref:Uncharacterized protein n=1 Tax=Lyophyllum shimeji TaxID=47721 RepID=A0A9P3UT58_LYOSH|nr:hypothetical protein LshimejAT787_1602180 [Lyophyllum shimeji]